MKMMDHHHRENVTRNIYSSYNQMKAYCEINAIQINQIYIYIAKRFSNPRKESTPCDGDGKRK